MGRAKVYRAKQRGERQKAMGRRQKVEGGGIVDLDKHFTKQGANHRPSRRGDI